LTFLSFSEPTLLLDESDIDESLHLPSTNDDEFKTLLGDCSNIVERLGLTLQQKCPRLMTNVIIMQQQLNIIRDSTSLSNSSSHSPSSLQKVQQSSFALVENSVESTDKITSILTTPKPFVRSQKRRNFKKKNHGVMTSDDVMQQYTDEEIARKAAEVEKEEKKKIREKKKLQAETLRNMKKEKKDERDRAKVEKQLQAAPKRRRIVKASVVVDE
jgi:hypothetical protein